MKQLLLLVACAVLLQGCGRTGSAAPPSASGKVTPVYSKDTGRLEELVSDRDGDGRVDTRAFMDGVRIVRIEIDRDRDGRADRWEFYGATRTSGEPLIERAEESEGPDGRIVRREFFDGGAISRVEEDTDGNDRVDKWEHYTRGVLTSLDLDLDGRGKPTRRLVYGPGGNVDRIESDPDGDGSFELVRQEAVPLQPATSTHPH